MIDLKFIKLENKSIWEKTLKSEKNISPGHLIDYAMLEHLHTSKETLLLIFFNNNKKIISPFHLEEYENKKRLFSLRGYSGFNEDLDKETLGKLKIALRKMKISSIYFTNNPFIESEVKAIKDYSKYKNITYLMNLKKDIKTIHDESHTLIKRNLKKSEKINSVVLINDKFINEGIKNLYNENLERLGLLEDNLFTSKSIDYLLEKFDKILIVSSLVEGKPVCVSLFNYDKKNANYLSTFSTKNYNILTARNIFEAINIFKKKKIDLLNFGGGVKDNPGIELFKSRLATYKKKIYEFQF
jgi:hypothetical protein